MFLSSNNGTSWTSVNSGLPAKTPVLSLGISGNKVLAGTGTGIYLSTNNGSNWVDISSGLATNTIANCISFDNTYSYIATNGAGVWKRPLNEIVTGIEFIEFNKDKILVYPNPSNDIITVELQELKSVQSYMISIYDIKGQLINDFLTSGNKTNIDVSAFSGGIYIVKAKRGNFITTGKFVKK